MVSPIAAVLSLLVLLASADVDQPCSTSIKRNPKPPPLCSSEAHHGPTSIGIHDDITWHPIPGNNNSICMRCVELPDIRMGEDDRHRAVDMSFDNAPVDPEYKPPAEDPRMV